MLSNSKWLSFLGNTKRAFNRIGLDVQSYANTLGAARKRLISDLGITLVLDVGANAGWYASDLRSQGYKDRIISFEPLKKPFAELQKLTLEDPNWTAFNVALGSKSGSVSMYVSENSFSSSLLKVTGESIAASARTQIAAKEDVQVCTLDQLIPDLGTGSSKVLLKLDTQGFEREVILGAKTMLSRCSAVECELSLVELYEKQPLFYEVCQLLYEQGFVMTWIERGFRNANHELLQADALFVARRTNKT